LVSGGGPGGCAAAITAARAGLNVILLERDASARHRPGETLHPGIEALFETLGLAEHMLSRHYRRHPGSWIGWPGPAHFVPFGGDEQGEWQGFQAPRDDFDATLRAAAAAAGVVVRRNAAVRAVMVDRERVVGIQTEQGPLRGHFVVDAMGDRHLFARQLAIPVVRCSRPLTVRYGYARGRCPARDHAPLIAADENGWTWTACIGEGRYQWTRLDLRREGVPTVWRPAELEGLADEGPVRGADVTWRIARRLAGRGFFMVGDAAAVLDPSSSHGILRAMMSGMMAGHLAAAALSKGLDEVSAITMYDAWMNDWFQHDVRELHKLYRSGGFSVLSHDRLSLPRHSSQQDRPWSLDQPSQLLSEVPRLST
jgi:flavin-dependent dehydrogenase